MSQTSASATGSKRRVLATPLARAVAADRGVDLTTVTGTGRAGRILRADGGSRHDPGGGCRRGPGGGCRPAPAEPVATTPAGAVDSREHLLPGRLRSPSGGPSPGPGLCGLPRTSS